MEILYLLLPLTFLLVTAIVGFVIWAIQNGQFDDLTGPGHRILSDDDEKADCEEPSLK